MWEHRKAKVGAAGGACAKLGTRTRVWLAGTWVGGLMGRCRSVLSRSLLCRAQYGCCHLSAYLYMAHDEGEYRYWIGGNPSD